jgi:hypothetical protein
LIIFELSVTAKPSHPEHRAGVTCAAVLLVDSDDLDEAKVRAAEKASELHWEPGELETAIRLPPNPDTSGWSTLLAQAHRDALRLGHCLVVYPETEH